MTTVAQAVWSAPDAPTARRGFRPEVQGLRAVAVVLVVLFHLWPNRLPGGYVGVDVFFVISGFLITSHIHRELEATGTIVLRRFWARRVRRLLPASLLVLVVSGIATVALVPATMWAATARQVAASALYVQNWVLAADAVDYMAADNVPTVAQHYWSLSVEEQFYLVWPVLMLGLGWWHRRARRPMAQQRWFLVVGLGALAAVSLVWSVLATSADRSSAYFVTPTRVWEFAAGALLALLGDRRIRGGLWAGVLAWAGLAAIVLAGLAFDAASMFPGWIALLPVLGTVAVIWAGRSRERWSPARWLSLSPMTFIGDISYSVYLWHWPLIVVWPFVTATALRTVDKSAIVVVSVLLAAVTKVWVEDPARRSSFLAAAPWRSFTFAVVGMAVVIVGCAALLTDVDRRVERAATNVAQSVVTGCSGPAALDPSRGCHPIEGDGPLVPPPEVVVRQNTEPAYPGCQSGPDSAEVSGCVIGDTSVDPVRVVAVVGDSHATQWFPALDELGRQLGWQVRTYTRSSCPWTTAVRVQKGEQGVGRQLSCLEWGAEVRDTLLEDGDVSAVFTAAFTTAYTFESPENAPLDDPRVDGFSEMWRPVIEAGVEVFTIADVPRTLGGNVPNCLAAHADDRMACAVPRSRGPQLCRPRGSSHRSQ